jgi:hypothetical protein
VVVLPLRIALVAVAALAGCGTASQAPPPVTFLSHADGRGELQR